MAMEHKAFAFDWSGFEQGLLPLLTAALRTNDPTDLLRFVEENHEHLTDPYEGDPLPPDWRQVFEVNDVHTIGDFALTRYYDPAGDRGGIGYEWMRLADERPDLAYGPLLGKPVGLPDNRFDPGKYGSYFQRPADLPATIAALAGVGEPALAPFLALVRSCADRGSGVYVTF